MSGTAENRTDAPVPIYPAARVPKGPTRYPTSFPTGYPSVFPTSFPSQHPTKWPTTIHENIPCSPGHRYNEDIDICVDCESGRYNHGGMPFLRDVCYDIPEDAEYEYLSSTNVHCRRGWRGNPVYEDGEYNAGCVDVPSDAPPSETDIPSNAPTFESLTESPSVVPTWHPTVRPTLQTPVNGGWSHWGDCEPYANGCGLGIQNRSCTNPTPAYGGSLCSHVIHGVRVPASFYVQQCIVPCYPLPSVAPTREHSILPWKHSRAPSALTSTKTPSTAVLVLTAIAGIFGLLGLFYCYKLRRRYFIRRGPLVAIAVEERGIAMTERRDDEVVEHLPPSDGLRLENI